MVHDNSYDIFDDSFLKDSEISDALHALNNSSIGPTFSDYQAAWQSRYNSRRRGESSKDDLFEMKRLLSTFESFSRENFESFMSDLDSDSSFSADFDDDHYIWTLLENDDIDEQAQEIRDLLISKMEVKSDQLILRTYEDLIDHQSDDEHSKHNPINITEPTWSGTIPEFSNVETSVTDPKEQIELESSDNVHFDIAYLKTQLHSLIFESESDNSVFEDSSPKKAPLLYNICSSLNTSFRAFKTQFCPSKLYSKPLDTINDTLKLLSQNDGDFVPSFIFDFSHLPRQLAELHLKIWFCLTILLGLTVAILMPLNLTTNHQSQLFPSK